MQKMTRRDFIKVAGGVVVGGALATTISRPPLSLEEVHAARPSKRATGNGQSAGVEKTVPTVCLMCPQGCGMTGRVVDGRLVKLEGNPLHPVNAGVLCPKGQAATELLYNPDRVRGPLRRVGKRGEGNWESIPWETALSLVTERLSTLHENGHPE